MALCVNCGAQIADGSKFCNKCGKSQIEKPAPVPEPPPQPVPEKPDKQYEKAKTMIKIPFIVFGITVLSFLIAMVSGRPASLANPLPAVSIVICLVGALLAPLPCVVITVIGTVISAKAVKAGFIQYRRFFLIGLIEIVLIIVNAIIAVAFIAYTSHLI